MKGKHVVGTLQYTLVANPPFDPPVLGHDNVEVPACGRHAYGMVVEV